MKVEFIKNHDLSKKGQIVDLQGPLANYLIRCGVVKAYTKPKK